MTPQEFARLKRLGSRAADIRQDSEFKEIIAFLKERVIRDWAATIPGDRKRRELFYHELIAIGRIEQMQQSTPLSGEVMDIAIVDHILAACKELNVECERAQN